MESAVLTGKQVKKQGLPCDTYNFFIISSGEIVKTGDAKTEQRILVRGDTLGFSDGPGEQEYITGYFKGGMKEIRENNRLNEFVRHGVFEQFNAEGALLHRGVYENGIRLV